jgi:hypothetical protein
MGMLGFLDMGFRNRAGVIAFVACVCLSQQVRAKSRELPPGILAALAADEKSYCDQFLGDYKKGCQKTFRENLSWRELLIAPSGQTAILVQNGESCGTAGCALSLFIQQSDTNFAQVLGTDGEVGTLSSVNVLKAVTNGHYNIQKTWHDGKTQTLYLWDGLRYSAH